MTQGESDDPVYFSEMVESIIKKDQVHLNVVFIIVVLLKQPVEFLLDLLEIPAIFVQPRVDKSLI